MRPEFMNVSLLLWLLVTLTSTFAIFCTVHPNQFCNSALVPIVLWDSLKSEPLTNISRHQETINLSSACDLRSWVLTATHKAVLHIGGKWLCPLCFTLCLF